jgi:hypothetical protein
MHDLVVGEEHTAQGGASPDAAEAARTVPSSVAAAAAK